MHKSITEDQAIALAQLWLKPLTQGNSPQALSAFAREVLQSKNLQREAGITFSRPMPDPSTILRRIKEAFRVGSVAVERKERISRIQIDPELTAKMLDRFRSANVGEFIVCDTSELSNESDRAFAVGLLAGGYLLEKVNFFRNNDRIGVGSGRSVQGVARGMLRQDRKKIENVTLFSMVGQTMPSFHPLKPDEMFNADQNIGMMANYFLDGARAHLMAGRLAYADIQEAIKIRWLTHLHALNNRFMAADDLGKMDERPEPPFWHPEISLEERSLFPNTAVVGVGSLEPGHALYDLMKERKRKRTEAIDDYLGPITETVEKVIEASDFLRERYGYSPVGEVCNRYFLADCPKEHRDRSEVKQARLNIFSWLKEITENNILCTPKRLYSLTDRLAVVASGERKVFAMRTLIEHPMINISYLFVGSELAESLLAD